MVDLRRIVYDDVKIRRMVRRVVLMISLRWIEHVEGLELRDNLALEHFRFVQLIGVCCFDSLLFGACKENRRAILRTAIGSLPIELRGIVCDGKENLK